MEFKFPVKFRWPHFRFFAAAYLVALLQIATTADNHWFFKVMGAALVFGGFYFVSAFCLNGIGLGEELQKSSLTQAQKDIRWTDYQRMSDAHLLPFLGCLVALLSVPLAVFTVIAIALFQGYQFYRWSVLRSQGLDTLIPLPSADAMYAEHQRMREELAAQDARAAQEKKRQRELREVTNAVAEGIAEAERRARHRRSMGLDP